MRERYDYLLLTALAEEDAALTEALKRAEAQGPDRARHAGAPTGQRWRLKHDLGMLNVLTVTLHGAGEEKAREWTRLLLASVAPQYVGLVGIAGAADASAEFGDILIADRIWYYEAAKVMASDTDYRGPEHRSEGLLLDRLRNPNFATIQRLFPHPRGWRPPRVGVIASGEKVVANDPLKRQLLGAKWNVIGFEMEGHGFANEVVRALGSEKWFMVRSVSDHADQTKSDEPRELACQRAAQYLVGFILDSDLCAPHDPVPSIATSQPAVIRPTGEDLSELLNDLAVSFAEHSPDDFLSVMGRFAGKPLPVALRVAQAVAHWRRDDAKACHTVCQDVLAATADSESFSTTSTVATRLSAWSLLRLGSASSATELLERQLSRVADVGERGRWADLLAQCYRLSGESDPVLSLSWYMQARRLKAEAGDYFGEVIALQQIARVCLERSDFEACEAHYRDAMDVASARDFPQRSTCETTSLLGLAWLDLIRRNDISLRLARRRLALAGTLLRDVSGGALERDLRAAASAMSRLLDLLTGSASSVTGWQDVKAMWASVVYGQARVLCGEDIGSVAREVLQRVTGRPSISPRAVPALLEWFRPSASPPPDRAISSLECRFWPLSEWTEFARPGDGVRLIEGLISLYSLIIGRLEGGGAIRDPTDPPVGLDSLVSALSQYGHSQSRLAFAREVASVATIVRQAVPLRNRWAHALPGDTSAHLSKQLDRLAGLALKEARMLRAAEWVDETTILLGGSRIDLSPAVVWNPSARRREIHFPDRQSFASPGGEARIDSVPI